MTVKVIMNAKAKAGTGSEVAKFLQSIMPEARAYAGCSSAVSYQGLDDSDDVVSLQTWESREDNKKYISWRRDEGVTDELKKMLDGEPSLGYIEDADI